MSNQAEETGWVRPRKARTFWLVLILVGLVAGGGFGLTYLNQKTAVLAQVTGESKRSTKQVRTGSITTAASGSVTLVASQESSLAFTASGTIAELNVAVGDRVTKGQVLARLDTLDELEAEIKSAGQDLLSAQQELASFKAKAPANLANAQLQVIQAQEALVDAQSSAVNKNTVRCDEDKKDAMLARYNRAVDQLNALGDGGGNADYYLAILLPQKKVVDQALAAYQACSRYTDYQVATSQINLTSAESALQQAEKDLDTLTANNGLDPTGLAAAENKVATAQLALEEANDALEGATLIAPFDGTILSVFGKIGDTIEMTSRVKSIQFLTIADLAHPLLKLSIDETDLSLVNVGQTAIVTFDAFPERTFKGSVMRVDPEVSSTLGASAVTGLIQLDLSQETDVPTFPKNLSGSVQIIQASVENALLIPVEALQKQDDGTYVVSVVGADGRVTLKPVEAGLSDVASVEIKSGLTADDIVVTGTAQ
jgi:multidrug efflux pump subunit AcrA (membrane-fusion protein)